MPGQPLKRACFEALDNREEEIFSRIAGGEFVTRLCAEVLAEPYEETGHGEPNTGYFYEWLDAADGRRARYQKVQESKADALAERSVTDLEDALERKSLSSAEAQVIKAKSSTQQWLASRLNRERYGDTPGVQVNMNNVGQLHLDALRRAGSVEGARQGGTLPPAERDQLPEPEGLPEREYRDGLSEPETATEADYEVVEEAGAE